MDFVFFFIDNLYPSTTLNIKVMINIFIEKYANPKKSKYLNSNFPSTEFENKSCSVWSTVLSDAVRRCVPVIIAKQFQAAVHDHQTDKALRGKFISRPD